MADDTPIQKKRQRKPKPEGIYPVEAIVQAPGLKAPLVIRAFWVRREPTRYVFGLPNFDKPYMTLTYEVATGPGVVVQLSELVTQQATPQPASVPLPLAPEQGSAGGAGAVLRTEDPVMRLMSQRPQALRSVVRPNGPPVSEVADEKGNIIAVPAAFGLSPG